MSKKISLVLFVYFLLSWVNCKPEGVSNSSRHKYALMSLALLGEESNLSKNENFGNTRALTATLTSTTRNSFVISEIANANSFIIIPIFKMNCGFYKSP
ncbi:MAG: hypothetical protein SFU98_12590 [Leptospiraceae bacterium]|nr:hypothetical protein [Leptospiraceae bacterium]